MELSKYLKLVSLGRVVDVKLSHMSVDRFSFLVLKLDMKAMDHA